MLSVILPTRNRAHLLRDVLEALLEQELAQNEFEVIVVDNGSKDSTRFVVDSYQTRFSDLTYFYKSEPGLHIGRHTGLSAAKGDILVYADDDIKPLPTWLLSIREAFQQSNVAMVGGNNFPMYIEKPPVWLERLWNRQNLYGYKAIPSLSVIEFIRSPKAISPKLVWGCNYAIRKEVLLAAGGFHPDGMPKELIRFRGDGETHVSQFVIDSGMKCVFHPGASVYHMVTPERMTHAYFRQRGFNQGVSDSYTLLRQDDQYIKSVKQHLIKRVVRYGVRQLQSLFDDTEVKRAFEEFKLGHREGYDYHQTVYKDDPEVREWVHRSTYF